MTRRGISKRLGPSEARLRIWERCGLLPRFGTVPARPYEDRVRLPVAGRRVLSMQRMREALAIGGC